MSKTIDFINEIGHKEQAIADGKLLHDFAFFSGRSIAECAKFLLRGEIEVYGARALIEELGFLRTAIDAIEMRAQMLLPKGDGLRTKKEGGL